MEEEGGGKLGSLLGEGEDGGEDDDEDDNEEEDDGDAGPLAGVLLVDAGGGEIVGAVADEGLGAADVALDVVQLLPLRLHQHRHLQQAALQLRNRPVPLLDLRHHRVHRRLVGRLPRDGVVAPPHRLPVLGRDPAAELREGFHGVPELLAEAGHDGAAGAVGGAPGAAAGDGAVGSVGAVQGLEAELDELGLLEGEGDVGVHAAPELPHRRRLVQRLPRLVRLAQAAVEPLHLPQLVLDRLHVLEEPVQVSPAGRRSRPHLHVPCSFSSGFDVPSPRRGREEIVHLSLSLSLSLPLFPSVSPSLALISTKETNATRF
ncbi:hypothetical protein MUK42_22203 [Musa troglodytarum]|uniref:Uncharacterized protein n=1 Tax=Musa troglodytarum TaxID=320322 RepID=A0A9E7GBI8_9LILI|nr:hypothetical protein MUK42_22203 [Musa troglodytarum]